MISSSVLKASVNGVDVGRFDFPMFPFCKHVDLVNDYVFNLLISVSPSTHPSFQNQYYRRMQITISLALISMLEISESFLTINRVPKTLIIIGTVVDIGILKPDVHEYINDR